MLTWWKDNFYDVVDMIARDGMETKSLNTHEPELSCLDTNKQISTKPKTVSATELTYHYEYIIIQLVNLSKLCKSW